MSATTGLVLGTLGLVGLGASYYLYKMSNDKENKNYQFLNTDNIPLFHDPDVKELPTDPELNEEMTLGGKTRRRRKKNKNWKKRKTFKKSKK